MATNDIKKRKKNLVQKLKGLLKTQLSEIEFEFIGACGCTHVVNTKLNKEINGILSGEFIRISTYGEKLLLCVGVGKGCVGCSSDDRNHDSFWFLLEGKNGIGYIVGKTFKELEILRDAVIVP